MTSSEDLRSAVHVFCSFDDKPQVIEPLPTLRSICRCAVEGKVITTRGEVGIVRIRSPYDTHTQWWKNLFNHVSDHW